MAPDAETWGSTFAAQGVSKTWLYELATRYGLDMRFLLR